MSARVADTWSSSWTSRRTINPLSSPHTGGAAGASARRNPMPCPSIQHTVIQDALRDIRHALSLLARSLGFTAAAVRTLPIGIGATSAVFSVVRAVLLEPLPYRDPDRVVTIWETNRGGTVRNVIAPGNFVAWRERARTLDHFGMVERTNLVL